MGIAIIIAFRLPVEVGIMTWERERHIVLFFCFSVISYPLRGTTPTMFCAASSPNLKTPVITFVNAHTIWHYLQTSMLSSNKTLSTECCSGTSINLVSWSIVISPPCFTSLQMSFTTSILYSLLHFIQCRMCVCYMFINPLKGSGVRWLHFEVFSAIQV